MPKTATSDLKERIIASLTDANSCLWFPHLTDDLVETGLRKLEDETGITASNYGTERVILKNTNAPRDILISLPIHNGSETPQVNIQIEELSRSTIQQYKNSELTFYNREEIVSSEVLCCLSDAFQIIGKGPSLFTAVVSLVKSLHIIKPESDEYDVSFSEPHIPFSIFVSIPKFNSEVNALRVAEAIVHEAMHLQLTIIEEVVSLQIDSDKKYYSPWKEEFRNAQGVLHALYVFGVVKIFISDLLKNHNPNASILKYLLERNQEIDQQIKEMSSFAFCSDLTIVGKKLVKTLISV